MATKEGDGAMPSAASAAVAAVAALPASELAEMDAAKTELVQQLNPCLVSYFATTESLVRLRDETGDSRLNDVIATITPMLDPILQLAGLTGRIRVAEDLTEIVVKTKGTAGALVEDRARARTRTRARTGAQLLNEAAVNAEGDEGVADVAEDGGGGDDDDDDDDEGEWVTGLQAAIDRIPPKYEDLRQRLVEAIGGAEGEDLDETCVSEEEETDDSSLDPCEGLPFMTGLDQVPPAITTIRKSFKENKKVITKICCYIEDIEKMMKSAGMKNDLPKSMSEECLGKAIKNMNGCIVDLDRICMRLVAESKILIRRMRGEEEYPLDGACNESISDDFAAEDGRDEDEDLQQKQVEGIAALTSDASAYDGGSMDDYCVADECEEAVIDQNDATGSTSNGTTGTAGRDATAESTPFQDQALQALNDIVSKRRAVRLRVDENLRRLSQFRHQFDNICSEEHKKAAEAYLAEVAANGDVENWLHELEVAIAALDILDNNLRSLVLPNNRVLSPRGDSVTDIDQSHNEELNESRVVSPSISLSSFVEGGRMRASGLLRAVGLSRNEGGGNEDVTSTGTATKSSIDSPSSSSNSEAYNADNESTTEDSASFGSPFSPLSIANGKNDSMEDSQQLDGTTPVRCSRAWFLGAGYFPPESVEDAADPVGLKSPPSAISTATDTSGNEFTITPGSGGTALSASDPAKTSSQLHAPPSGRTLATGDMPAAPFDDVRIDLSGELDGAGVSRGLHDSHAVSGEESDATFGSNNSFAAHDDESARGGTSAALGGGEVTPSSAGGEGLPVRSGSIVSSIGRALNGIGRNRRGGREPRDVSSPRGSAALAADFDGEAQSTTAALNTSLPTSSKIILTRTNVPTVQDILNDEGYKKIIEGKPEAPEGVDFSDALYFKEIKRVRGGDHLLEMIANYDKKKGMLILGEVFEKVLSNLREGNLERMEIEVQSNLSEEEQKKLKAMGEYTQDVARKICFNESGKLMQRRYWVRYDDLDDIERLSAGATCRTTMSKYRPFMKAAIKQKRAAAASAAS